jgi:hypothetical protein
MASPPSSHDLAASHSDGTRQPSATHPPKPSLGHAVRSFNAFSLTHASFAGQRTPGKSATCVNAQTCISQDRRRDPSGSNGWPHAAGRPWEPADSATRRCRVNAPHSTTITAPITGEPRESERLTRGSEGGRWKSTHRGHSLAAYPTARPVREGEHAMPVGPTIPTSQVCMKCRTKISQASLRDGTHDKSRTTEELDEEKSSRPVLKPSQEGRSSWLR